MTAGATAMHAGLLRGARQAMAAWRARAVRLRVNMAGVRRLGGNVGANLYGQAVSIAIQLLSVPAFLHHWGPRRYGVWLMLAAIPTYFSIADVGMVAVAQNKMTMLRADGEARSANVVFQSVFLLTLLAIGAIVIPTLLVVMTVHIDILDTAAKRWTLIALILIALGTVFNGLFDAVLVASGRYATAILGANSIRLLEWIAGMAALMAGAAFLGVASAMLSARLAFSLGWWLYVRVTQRHFVWGLADASRAELKLLTAPALSFLAFPMGMALSIQGMTLLVGALLGPVFLTMFNTYRTVSRVVVQLIAAVNHAVWPEFSRLYGARRPDLLRATYARTSRLVLVTTVAVSVALFFAAPRLLAFWTKGLVPFDPTLFGLFVIVTAVGSVSHLPRVLLMATNRHGLLTSLFLLFSLIGVLVAWALTIAVGGAGSVLGTLVGEVAIAFASFRLAAQLLARSDAADLQSTRP